MDVSSALSYMLDVNTGLKVVGLASVFLVWWAVLEQIRLYRYGASKYPGPMFVIPFVNSVVEMVYDPEAFWKRQHSYDENGVSWNAFVGRLTLVTTNPELSRKVMSNNSPDSFFMEIHPNAKRIFSSGNIALMWGEPHKRLRKSFLTLFSHKAMAIYLARQEQTIRSHVSKWMEDHEGKEIDVRHLIRPLTLAISQGVFVGEYLRDPKKFGDDYQWLNEGMLCLPIYFPGTTLWKATRARERLEDELEEIATLAKKRIGAGEEPGCLIDFWVERILQECDDAAKSSSEKPEYERSRRMAETMVDFLFAAQDASTASLVWVVKLMADHPDVLEKVRAEQDIVRPNNGELTYERLEKMMYTKAVVMEVLRYKPPAMSIPQSAQQNIRLNEETFIPKGTLMFPSLWAARNHGWTEPERFDPERMMPHRDEMLKNRANFLTFGAGPHYCVGKEYAINTLVAFLAICSTTVEWTRRDTEDSERIKYLPTTYPYDCLVTMKLRA